jgi:pyruvate ferredoxin oxidoreductase alpha subunit
MYNFIYGLGGRDVRVEDFVGMFDNVLADTENKAADTYEFWGVRE